MAKKRGLFASQLFLSLDMLKQHEQQFNLKREVLSCLN